MAKLCLLYNFAPKYRKAIFSRIEDRWACQWCFGQNATDIKGLDMSFAKCVETFPVKRLPGSFYWQKGAVRLLGRKDISTYFILGDPHCLSSWILVSALRTFKPRRKIYFWTHGWYGRESMLTKLIKKAFFKMAHGIFLYGNYARKLMVNEGFDEKKLFVIANSLDYSRHKEIRSTISSSGIYKDHFKNDYPTIVFIGRLTNSKRLDLLIEAVEKLRQENRKFNIALIGAGEAESMLKEKASIAGLSDRIWFYGECYDEEANAELIYNADLCVSPGNVGLTAIHTLTFGTPVITHDDFRWQGPEFEAIKPGKTGDFFKFGDVGSLASKISEWFDSHPDRDAVRRECYKEIDTGWNPEYQMEVLENNLIVE